MTRTQITFQSSAATSRSRGVITAFADAQSAATLKRAATTRGDALLRDATALESRGLTDWVVGAYRLNRTWASRCGVGLSGGCGGPDDDCACPGVALYGMITTHLVGQSRPWPVPVWSV